MSDSSFLSRLNLPLTAKSAARFTRRDGEVVRFRFNECVLSEKTSYYENGLRVDKIPGGWKLESWTIYESRHVLSCQFQVFDNGNLATGIVNCFALGWMHVDEEYFEQFMEEIREKSNWDQINQ